NSRGAIARFDRGAIEIRVMDIQECPTADLGIIELVVEVLKALVQEEWVTYEAQARWHEDELYRIFQNAIKGGESAQIENVKYSEVLCPDHTARMTFQELWESLYQQVQHRLSTSSQTVLEHILQSGTLATRILRALQGDFSVNNISRVYRALVQCLADGVCFD